MAFSRARPAPHLRAHLAFVTATALAFASGGAALAGTNDLQLLNLCPPAGAPALGGTPECSWIHRDANGLIVGSDGKPGPVTVPADGQAAFRSLMSELGVVIAPRLQTPADTLGYAGFQFSAELGVTKINQSRSYWNGVAGVDAGSPAGTRPDSYLTTVGGFVRKGMWFPLPAFEFGAGALNIVGSRMYVVQGYAKIALQEGFHGWWLPSFAVRGSASQLLGTEQVDLNVYGVDVLISKAFGLAGTSRIEPFLGWNVLFIDAQSGVIDATPGCDSYEVRQATDMNPVSSHCAAAQNGTWNDTSANFTFPQQDVITRYRWSGGFKLKLSVLFLVGEYDFVQAGRSRDGKQPEAARDGSGSQQSFSLSAGFDF
ncbi:MAG TPA: hypothetical protein VMT47_12450 [Polyangia bacterium]|nr:hypothetical protein [Polyangia bacterium]